MNRKTTVEEEKFRRILRHVKNLKRFEEFTAFCTERLNSDENASVEDIWNAWCKRKR